MKILSFLKNFYFPEVDHHLKTKITIGRFLTTLVLILTIFGLWLFLPVPKANISNKQTSYDLNQQINIDFSRPVKRNELKFTIEPEISGTWSWQKPYLGSKHLFTRLVFTPETMYEPNTNYKLHLSNIEGIINITSKTNEFTYDFKTKMYPSVSKVTPAKDTKDIKIDSQIEVVLDQKNDNLAEFNFDFEPKIEFEQSLDDQKVKYILKPKSTLAQDTTYNLKVSRTLLIYDKNEQKVIKRDNPETQYEGKFTTQSSPGLSSFSPTGDHVLTTISETKIVFTADMNRASVENNIEINPKLEGSFDWENDKTLKYKITKSLSYATTYSFKIKSGTKNKDGGFLTNDAINSFSTIGNVYVTSFSPANGSGGVKINSNISVTFDQAVDHNSAETHFSLSDGRGGSFAWSGNTMIFNPTNDFSKSASYTATISSGIKSISGLDSNRAFLTTFYTEENFVKLIVPLDYQDYSLSCEVASLKMALSYKGVPVSEDALMSFVGYDPTPHVGNVWGDPYTAFVGSINGKDLTTGYGVYWGPIENAAKHYRPAQAFTGWSASQLASTIEAGNPVVIWGFYGNGYPVSWTTPDGKYIPAYYGEHARTVIGFYGLASNPTKFVINDPISGQITWTTSQFLSNWAAFGNAGVVVY